MKSTSKIRVGLLAYGAIGEGSTVELSLMGALDENRAGSSLLEAATASGLTKFESIETIKRGFKYGKNLTD